LPPPTAATRCRMRDQICKETKEKKIGFAPSYESFRGLWAGVFNWKANQSMASCPNWMPCLRLALMSNLT
jgi:hypothetical protein